MSAGYTNYAPLGLSIQVTFSVHQRAPHPSTHLHVGKVRMLQRIHCSNACFWLVGQHARQEVDPCLVQRRHQLCNRPWAPLRENTLVIRQPRHAWPQCFVGRAQRPENTKQLIYFLQIDTMSFSGLDTHAPTHRLPRKQRPPVDHLSKYAPCTPYVDSRSIALDTQQDLWRAVPQRHHLVGKRLDHRRHKCARQAKVCKFEPVLCNVHQHLQAYRLREGG